ncbi:MAG: hypothetical protein HW391_202 [Chloroflexi bacterium]|nr:hypothetical protein [Chloroflexota bacterium]
MLVAACETGQPTLSNVAPTGVASPSVSANPVESGAPTATPDKTPGPSVGSTATPTLPGPTASPGALAGCSGSDENRAFFTQAAAAMAWPVYCVVLPDGWFLETGRYQLADGGRLDVTYRGPGDARFSVAQGNACLGLDADTCAPRDAVIGPAAFGDRDGELGRLANGLVLDVDRGANPSWRATGLGLTEDEFRAISVALLRAEPGA